MTKNDEWTKMSKMTKNNDEWPKMSKNGKNDQK